MQLFIFSPSPSPALLSLLPADPSGGRGSKPRGSLANLGRSSKRFLDLFLSAFTPFPQVQQQMGRERKASRKKKTLWCHPVICCFFPGFVCTAVPERCLGQAGMGTGQADGSGGILSGEAAGGHRWRVLASRPSGRTGRACGRAPRAAALPAAGFTRPGGFPPRSCCSAVGDRPARCLAA